MAIISLNAVAVVGAGVSLPSVGPTREATMYVVASPGFNVLTSLEGTVDGTNWISVGEQACEGTGYVNTQGDGPLCSAYRANLNSIDGGAVTASILIRG